MSAVRASAASGSGRDASVAPVVEGRTWPVLRLVSPPLRSAPRLPFVLLVTALLSIGLAGLLLLSLQRNQAAFTQGRLATIDAGLADRVQALQRQVEADQDPTVLASRAAALGMVPGVMAGYLGPTGAVLGAVPSGAPVPSRGAAGTDGVVVAGQPAAAAAVSPAISSRGSATARSTAPTTTSTKAPSVTRPAAKPSRSASASTPTTRPTPTPTRTGT